MKYPFLILYLLTYTQVIAQTGDDERIRKYYNENKGNQLPSKSLGTVSAGKLENAKLIPFEGNNYQYFDTTSYLGGRAFLNDQLKKTILETYQELEKEQSGRKFFTMECSNKNGGKIFPHRTHQNGLSTDFMMPLLKQKKPYYALDTIGASHYWLDFDDKGNYSNDKSISIDFELVALHILKLNENAMKNGLRISKVIIKIELKDELFAGPYGQRLKNSGIYIVKSLTPLINSLHDDHYHIDFAPL